MPKEKMVPVMVRVPQSVYDRIPAERGNGGRNVRGGVSSWMLDLVYDKLAMSPPTLDPDLSRIDPSKLDPKLRAVVKLYQEGLSVKELVEELRKRKVPTVRGGQWNIDNMRRTLTRLAEKHLKPPA